MNWAVGRPAEQSSTKDTTRVAAVAVDGIDDPAYYWTCTHTNEHSVNPWWRVYLHPPLLVTAVELVNRNVNGCEYQLYYFM